MNKHARNVFLLCNFGLRGRAGASITRAISIGVFLLICASGFNNAAQAQSYEQIAVGESHICGLNASGIVDCTTTAITKRLAAPDDLPALKEITAGQQHTCGITLDGEVVCWGQNAFGVLDVPQFDGPVQTLSAGRNHTCAIDTNGQVTCWGLNSNGQLDAPASTFVALSANLSASCGILNDGDLVCWTTDSKFFTPEPVRGPFTDLDMARNVGCALTANGDIECWATTFTDSPEAPASGPYTDLTVTDSSICGLKFDGLLDCSFPRFGDDEELLVDQFPTDVQFSSIERSAERFTPTPICGVRADNGAISCFGGNNLPATPGTNPATDSLDASNIALGLTALFYSTSSVELFWNKVPFTYPPISVEVFRDDELLITTDASFSFIDRDLIRNGESRYRVRTVDEAGNRGEFSNVIIVDRATGLVQVVPDDGPTPVNPRSEGFLQLQNLVVNSPSRGFAFEHSTAILSWETNNPMSVSLAGYEIRINNEPAAFVSADTRVFLNRDFLRDCRLYTVAAISTDGEILDFRTVVLNRTTGGQFCSSTN